MGASGSGQASAAAERNAAWRILPHARRPSAPPPLEGRRGMAAREMSPAAQPAPGLRARVRRLAEADHWVVFATARRDSAIQATVVTAGVMDHPLVGMPVVAFVARGGTVKLANLRRLPRAT